MWGNPDHLAECKRIIKEVKEQEKDEDGTELEVLVAQNNRDESTYDGIDWGGERVADEVCFVYHLSFYTSSPFTSRSKRKSKKLSLMVERSLVFRSQVTV